MSWVVTTLWSLEIDAMAQPMSVLDLYSCRLVTSADNQVAINTVYYLTASIGSPPSTDQDLADSVSAAVATAIRACMTNSATYKGCLVQRVNPRPPQVDVVSVVGAGSGSGGTTPIPHQVSGVLSWYTASAGRQHRGRIFVPFPDISSDDTDRTPTVTYTTNITAVGTALRTVTALATGGRTATVNFVLAHKQLPGPIWSSASITAILGQKKWGTQRRRGNYGRANTSPI
jgi:hypothetical protein